MAVNSFLKDAQDPKNPFTRALAIRTLGCLKVREVLEYLREPIANSLKDQDPYVRKSGVLSIAKLFDSYP